MTAISLSTFLNMEGFSTKRVLLMRKEKLKKKIEKQVNPPLRRLNSLSPSPSLPLFLLLSLSHFSKPNHLNGHLPSCIFMKSKFHFPCTPCTKGPTHNIWTHLCKKEVRKGRKKGKKDRKGCSCVGNGNNKKKKKKKKKKEERKDTFVSLATAGEDGGMGLLDDILDSLCECALFFFVNYSLFSLLYDAFCLLLLVEETDRTTPKKNNPKSKIK